MPCQREEENHDRAELESRMRDFEKLIGGGEESDVNFEIPRVQTMGELEQEIEALKKDVESGKERFLG
jgi:hypothetical protein